MPSPPKRLGGWGIAAALLVVVGAVGWLLLGSLAEQSDQGTADDQADARARAIGSVPTTIHEDSSVRTVVIDGAVLPDQGEATQRRRRVPRHGPRAARAPDTAKTFGTLSVNSDPWSLVYVDGKRIRSTPLVLYRLSSGQHALELVNPAQNLRASRMVTIRAGRDTRLSIELRQARP